MRVWWLASVLSGGLIVMASGGCGDGGGSKPTDGGSPDTPSNQCAAPTGGPDKAHQIINTGTAVLKYLGLSTAAGRFRLEDPELALAVSAGILMGLGALLQKDPERDDAATTDAVTEDLLRMFGMSARAAHAVCTQPLPEVRL